MSSLPATRLAAVAAVTLSTETTKSPSNSRRPRLVTLFPLSFPSPARSPASARTRTTDSGADSELPFPTKEKKHIPNVLDET